MSFREHLRFPPNAPIRSRRCLIIGEVAQAHDGSLGMAHAFIDAIANAGADAVKFQTHLAAAESTPAEPWRVKFSLQDETRYEYWKRMEFTEVQWIGLKQHAEERGLLFLSSAFSLEAIDLLKRIGVAAWKVASGEVSSGTLFDQMISTELPFLISTGMSPWSEIDAAVERVRSRGVPFAVMQCTTAYPCPPEKVGLNVLGEIRRRYGCAAGLSDHSGTIHPGIAAVTLGAEVIEVHVTLSREAFGPDVPASVTTGELRELVAGVDFIERALAHSVDKDAVATELKPLRDAFRKSIVTRRDLLAGAVLTGPDLALKKPGTGLSPDRLPQLLGRRLRRAVVADTLINEEDLEEVK